MLYFVFALANFTSETEIFRTMYFLGDLDRTRLFKERHTDGVEDLAVEGLLDCYPKVGIELKHFL